MGLSKRPSDSGRSAVTWLATSFVFLNGLVACTAIAVSFFQEPLGPLLIIVGVFATAAILLGIMHRSADEGVQVGDLFYWDWWRREGSLEDNYVARRKSYYEGPYGTNTPVTVEELRRIQGKEFETSWAPSGPASSKENPFRTLKDGDDC